MAVKSGAFPRSLFSGFTNSFHFPVYRIPSLLLYLSHLPRSCGPARLRRVCRARGVPPRASLQFAAAPAPAERLAGLRLLGGPRCCHAGVRKLCLRTCGRHFADLRSAFRASSLRSPGWVRTTCFTARAAAMPEYGSWPCTPAVLRTASRGPAVGNSRKLPPVARLGGNRLLYCPRCGHAGMRKLALHAKGAFPFAKRRRDTAYESSRRLPIS